MSLIDVAVILVGLIVIAILTSFAAALLPRHEHSHRQLITKTNQTSKQKPKHRCSTINTFLLYSLSICCTFYTLSVTITLSLSPSIYLCLSQSLPPFLSHSLSLLRFQLSLTNFFHTCCFFFGVVLFRDICVHPIEDG